MRLHTPFDSCAWNRHLADQEITLRSGTLVDAAIIEALSSMKNEATARDPEMSSTKNGNAGYFGTIETTKVNSVGPFAQLEATLEAIAGGHSQSRIYELLPRGFQPSH